MASNPTDRGNTGTDQQTLDSLFDISQLLNTQLDRETLETCVSIIECGVNPEALAAVVQELRRENTSLRKEWQRGDA